MAGRPAEDRRLLGIGLIVLAYTLFTGIDTSAKWLAAAGLPVLQIAFMRYFGHLVLAGAISLPRQGLGVLRTRHLRLEILRAVCLMGSTTLNLTAVTYLPLTATGSIMFTMPLMITALSMPLLGEHVGWRRWVAILVGFAGALVIIQPGTEAFHPAAILVFGAAFCTAIYFILTRKLSAYDSAATQQFYSGLVATIVFAPIAISMWVWPSDPVSWTLFLLIGCFGFSGHQLGTIAHGYAPASVLAPFSYTQIISMTAASVIVFHQPPDIWMFVGAPIVVASGLYIWLRERQLQRDTEPAPEVAAER